MKPLLKQRQDEENSEGDNNRQVDRQQIGKVLARKKEARTLDS